MLDFQLRQRHAPAHDRVSLAPARQPQQNPACDVAVPGVKPSEGPLRQARNRAVHPARLAVGAQAQCASVPVLPQLEQRGRQQR